MAFKMIVCLGRRVQAYTYYTQIFFLTARCSVQASCVCRVRLTTAKCQWAFGIWSPPPRAPRIPTHRLAAPKLRAVARQRPHRIGTGAWPLLLLRRVDTRRPQLSSRVFPDGAFMSAGRARKSREPPQCRSGSRAARCTRAGHGAVGPGQALDLTCPPRPQRCATYCTRRPEQGV
jgi:hypothetical protein